MTTPFTIITPTGDRPEAFALCAHYVLRQTMQPKEWLVIDDGDEPTPMPDCSYLKHIRRANREKPKHTLPMQMKAALQHVTTDIIIIMEDDDWYRKDYCEHMLEVLGEKDLAGLGNTVYYNIPARCYYVHDNRQHSAWCHTIFRKKLISFIIKICERGHRRNNPYIDLDLWRSVRDVSRGLELGNRSVSIGMKAMPGRQGTCSGHTCTDRFTQDTKKAAWLHKIIGDEDLKRYKPYMKWDVDVVKQSISVVSLITNYDVWLKNVASTLKGQPVELLPIPNAASAAKGLNIGLGIASNEIVVCCHQDVCFTEDWVFTLIDQIKCIGDDSFGVLGTFGRGLDLLCAGNIWNPYPSRRVTGRLPCKALSLDEHCLVLRKSSGLRFDESLEGFHTYGADICLQAREKGLNNYIINACLNHLSPRGKSDDAFKNSIQWLLHKWRGRTDLTVFRTMCFEVNFETGCSLQYL